MFSGTRTLNSAVIALSPGASTAGVTVGSIISGTGIPTGTTVVSFDAVSVTMSALATATSTNTACWVWNGEMRYETLGSSPNRIHVIQWSNMKPFGTTLTTVNGFRMNMQVRLYEADNAVEVVYGACTPGAATSTTTAQVGLRGPTNAFPANINNRLVGTAPANWDASTAGTSNSSACRFSSAAPANTIPNGLTYRWYDPPCSPPSANVSLSAPSCATSQYTATVNVTALGDAANVDVISSIHGLVADDVGIGSYPSNPNTLGTPESFTVVHNGNAICNLALGPVVVNDGDGVCHAATVYPIPDNGCATTTYQDLSFCVTDPGVQLGTDVFVGSVDLIISHTWNSDLQVQLINPNGTAVNLVTTRFGSGDNLGDPTLCPGGLFTLEDGGTAMSTSATSNVVGTFNPEQPLTTLHDGSDPNGGWTLRVCDNAGSDVGAVRFVRVNLIPCLPATGTATLAADCGNDQFFIDVDVTGLGTSSTVDITTDFLGDTEPTGVGLGITQIGPYPSGSTVVVTLVHDSDPSCDAVLSAVNFSCPPPNDLCGGAIAISCNSITAGSTIFANSADAPGTCTTTLNTTPGVWYTVIGWGGEMTASLCGSSYDTKIGVFDGTAGCGALVCVGGNDDDLGTGGAGVCGGGLQSSHQWNSTAGTPYYIYVTGFDLEAGNFVLQVACGDQNPPCTENTVELELNTDASGSETSWEIIPVGIPTPVCSGSGYLDNDQVFETCCLPDGCYRLRVLDSFGDGMSTGDYVLRDGNGNRIIDNTGGGAGFTSVSAIANSGAFCLPLGTDQVIYSQCDKMDFLLTDFLIASENAAVTAEFGVNDGNSGYQFWLFDPNGSYSRRVFFSHANPMVGAPPGALAAAHLRFGNLITNPVPVDQMLNVRIRGRVNGTFNEFGPTCQIMVVSTLPACPTTQLIDDPNNANFSCGVTRAFGGSDKVVAYPVAGANLYRFRFEQIGDAFARNITSPTSSRLLNWVTSPLVPGADYNVFVQASFDGG
ncbi:MAG: proprotein convertase P-domain-containing protein, partial [Flavobacteriales bacterium]